MATDLFQDLKTPNGVRYKQPLGLFINNEWVSGHGVDKVVTISPIDESEICAVHSAGEVDVDAAVKAARDALNGPWGTIDAAGKGELLYNLATLVEQHAHVLASIETWDNGKSYAAAKNEDVPGTVEILKYYAGWADKLTGQTLNTNSTKFAYTIREPIGVCAGIIPWNYPLLNAAYKIAPAVAAGNTVLIKVAEQTPLSALYLAGLVKEVGFPPGVVNILNGFGRKAGVAIAQHPDINKISFTGSTPTGREIMKMAATTMKRVTLETGGKSPMIVLQDADLQSAAHWAHLGIMSNSGQICSATSRIFVQDSIYDDFIDLFKRKVLAAKVGNPYDNDTFQGPQVTRAQYERVLHYIEAGKKEGATLALGGEACKNVNGSKGLFISPTVFTDVGENMSIYREEVFGPFVVICSFKTDEDALRMANDSSFGLASSVFTRDIAKAHRLARCIEAGTVWINSSNDPDVRVPFGGYKQSGLGHELGELGIQAYTITKAVHVNLESKL